MGVENGKGNEGIERDGRGEVVSSSSSSSSSSASEKSFKHGMRTNQSVSQKRVSCVKLNETKSINKPQRTKSIHPSNVAELPRLMFPPHE